VAQQVLDQLTAAGVDLDEITSTLEREGVESFCDSYHQLLACLADKAASLGTPIDTH